MFFMILYDNSLLISSKHCCASYVNQPQFILFYDSCFTQLILHMNVSLLLSVSLHLLMLPIRPPLHNLFSLFKLCYKWVFNA